MAYTQDQIDTLESALAAGVLEIEYNGKRVKYQSAAEMRRTLADMKSVNAADPKLRYSDTVFDRD